MSKIFTFAIGGTGSRVIRSLNYLMAAGVDIGNNEIVPLIIDPDASNGDLTRTVKSLNQYQAIRDQIAFDDGTTNGFFKTKLSSITNNFRVVIKDSDNKKFGEFIDANSLDKNNLALTQLLFSHKNLDADMEVGFKGNPNIGSVVLNQFVNSPDFQEFANTFQKGDRIFIIGSIFGGTGAAGFPLILKNLRNADPALSSAQALKESVIGAISVLPYFGVNSDEESEIDMSTFMSKTRAALRYYEKNVVENNSLNALYYVGDNVTANYENNEGSTAQQNDAHLVELLSALAIIDFANNKSLDTGGDGKAINPEYKEYGLLSDNTSNQYNFTNMGPKTLASIEKSMSQLLLSKLFIDQKLKDSLHQPWAENGLNIDSSFINPNSSFFSKLDGFLSGYFTWLEELAGNNASFAPFNLKASHTNLFELINGKTQKKPGFFAKNIVGFDKINHEMNSIQPTLTERCKEQKLLSLLYSASEKSIDDKINL
jgi:hypothetical protein